MRIYKLRLYNFSSYEGEAFFDFTTEPGKPIVLIGGQNGAGKTSLFMAIKIALYGAMAFGYKGITPHYIRKIKDHINTKAFQVDVLQAAVAVEITIDQNREDRIYTITRAWHTKEKRIVEDYSIAENGRKLSPAEQAYIENYLYTILPPELFTLFLFDGEEVGDIFATENYHGYIRNSLLTLCGMNVLSTVQKFCGSFVDKKATEEVQQLQNEYKKSREAIIRIQNRLLGDMTQEDRCKSEIETLQSELEDLERRFSQAGGITDEELCQMRGEEAEKDKKRSEISSIIRSFVETEMPFFILRNQIPAIEKRLHLEEKLSIYEYIKNMITPDFIIQKVKQKYPMPEQLSEELYQAILEKIYPGAGKDNPQLILDLSRDEISRVDQVIEMINRIRPQELTKQIQDKNAYAADIALIHQRLRDTLSEEEERKYHLQAETAKTKIQALQMECQTLNLRITAAQKELMAEESHKDELYQQIMKSAQNRHVYELSAGVSKIMQKLIQEKMGHMRQQLSAFTLQNLQQIYRKSNLISHIEVEEDFQLNLYQDANFTLQELRTLLFNMGNNGFRQTVGEDSIQKLMEYFQVQEYSELLNHLRTEMSLNNIFRLYKRIEIDRLSKGERQIFILALYWAMIQVSGKDIPFIIDTPYARIDANHREEISKKFFPQISGQVIILSTDEEVTPEYYRILKPYISQEYLLTNFQSENRTLVQKGYFFEVES